MRKMTNLFKSFTIIALVFSFFFAPVFGSVKAMSYNYDFWKNIIPSAEGLAHQDTYYADSFEYYKNDQYESVIEQLTKELDGASYNGIKELIFKQPYKDITSDDYNNAKLAIDSLQISSEQQQKIKDLISQKEEFEADSNLYKSINFNKITDIQVHGDKVYVLTTPTQANYTNITGTAAISDATQLVVINNDMKWEQCVNEFEITESVRNQFDDYYQWNRLSFLSVAAGDNHTIAVDKSGNLWAWGNNDKGQLKLDPTTTPSASEPVQITWIGDAEGIQYTNVYATGNTTFALDTAGRLWGWGENVSNLISSDDSLEWSYEAINVVATAFAKGGQTVKFFAVADDHAYVLDNEGKIWAWGDNSDGLAVPERYPELDANGNVIKKPDIQTSYKQPTEIGLYITRIDPTNPKPIVLKPIQIYASDTFSAIVDDENMLWMWGDNTYGQLGIQNSVKVTKPTKVEMKKNNVNVKIESVSLGDNHTVVVDQFANLWTFGSNSHLQLGSESIGSQTNVPFVYDDDIEYTKAFAFGNSSYVVDLENNAYVFGQNNNYQLGNKFDTENIPYTKSSHGISYAQVTGSKDATFALDSEGRLWVCGTNNISLGFDSTEDIEQPRYNNQKLVLKNIALNTLENNDIYKRAVYVAHSKDENIPAVYLRNALGVAVDDEFIYISDTQNARILKINKLTFVVEDICLSPANSTFKQLNLDSSVYQPSSLRQFNPTKITVSPTGRIYAIAEQVYEGIIEFNKQGDYNRYLGQNDVVTNPLKEMLRDYLTEEQLASFALTLPPLFTSISTDSKGFIYATSYPDTDSGNVAGQNMVKAINTSGKDCMKRNGYVTPNGDAVYISSHTNSNAILGPSYLVDVTINKAGNFTVVDEVRGRLFTYDSEGNLLYIAGDQPGGTKQNTASSLSENIIKPVAIDYLYRSYIDKNNQEVQEEIIIVADQQSKSLLYFETTEFGRLVNQATAAYTAGVDTAEKAQAVRAIWEEVRQRNTNYELAYLGIGKCLLVESDYVDTKDEQLDLYEEAMENFKLAHNGKYYSKAYGRYRDQILKDNFSWIMTGGVVLVLGYAGFIVYKSIKKKQAKKLVVEGGKK